MKKLTSLALVFALLMVIAGTALAGSYASEISSIHSRFSRQDSSASSAPQQLVNGLYRNVELLELIALKMGCDYSDVSSIHSRLSRQDSSASSAVQQGVNGLYRSVELLELITLKLDSSPFSGGSLF